MVNIHGHVTYFKQSQDLLDPVLRFIENINIYITCFYEGGSNYIKKT